MPRYRATKKFRKVLNKKTKELRGAILACIKQLGENPHHPGLHTHKVKGTKDVWEAYADQANRITFHWDNGTIVLRNNCNHSIIDRSP